MLRPACVNIPNLSLQLLLRKKPSWRAYPAAIISEDKPNGTVTEINREAARAGIKRGMRYAAALSLSAELRASVVSEAERADGIEEIERLLARFSPEIEPCPFDGESFWLNAAGLTTLYRSLSRWSEELSARLRDEELYSRVAVGFTRFGSYAAAKIQGGSSTAPVLFEHFEQEKAVAEEIPISVLPIPQKPRAVLHELGIQSVQQLFDLPRSGLKRRFGEIFEAFYDFLNENSRLPLQPKELSEELQLSRHFQTPFTRHSALSHELSELTSELAHAVAARREQVRELILILHLEKQMQITERLRPAQPTTNSRLLHRLLMLRLRSTEIFGGVIGIELSADRVARSREQLALFHKHERRDLAAGADAFAQLRAQLGNDAVQRAVILNEHAPERQFSWHSISVPAAPRAEHRRTVPHEDGEGFRPPYPLIRRIYLEAAPLTAAEAGSLFTASRAAEGGAAAAGPFRYSGLWWDRHPLEKSYYFVHSKSGQIRWLFYEETTDQWMLNGIVD